jgi:tripartite-type tricarboxylate transporter receptor subunit TctC
MRRIVIAAMIGSVAGLGILTAVCAQTYPVRPIRFIAPFAPGGTSDIVARILGVKLSEELGQSVVIDNRAGGGSTLGTAIAAHASPDGYTIIVNHVSLAVNQTFYSKLPYDAGKDLVGISRIGDTPNAVVTNSALPVNTMKDLIALARTQPGKLAYGSGGYGSAGHLPVLLLEDVARVKFNHIPYKGGGPSVTATISGEVQFSIPALPTVVPYAKQGRLRILAVTGAQRSPTMPEVPTVAEAAVPGYEFTIWYGMFAPAKTPSHIIARLNQALVKVLEMSDVQKQLSQQGIDSVSSSPEELQKLLRAEIPKWRRILQSSGIKGD